MTIRTFLWALVCLCIPKVQSQEPLYRQPGAPIEDRVNDLLERMTLDEKIGQLCCPLGWPMYVLVGFTLLAIILTCVLRQSWRIAQSNPVESIKSE